MRSLQAALVVVSLLVSAGASHAQSAYDYPWCAVYSGRRGAMSCYYASFAQCMQTISGIGGYCIRSPYYGHGPGDARPRRSDRGY